MAMVPLFQQHLQEAREQGLVQGLVQGLEQGREQGLEQGREQRKRTRTAVDFREFLAGQIWEVRPSNSHFCAPGIGSTYCRVYYVVSPIIYAANRPNRSPTTPNFASGKCFEQPLHRIRTIGRTPGYSHPQFARFIPRKLIITVVRIASIIPGKPDS